MRSEPVSNCSDMTDSIDVFVTPAEAGRILGITSDGVKVHDARLQPSRTPSGRRLYSRARVVAFAAERAERRAVAPPAT